MAGSSDDESTYNKAQRMQSGLGGSGLSYGERYRRNPDGSYGTQGSSRWNPGVGNVPDRLLQQALSAGNGWFASWAEGFLSGYGKARFSFRINEEGEVTGAGDFLLPLYDSEATSVFTQLGLRTMTDERVVGNFGLGQRFFPAPNFAFGYNIFLDQDFSREHTRGGAGIEAWYDWLRLSANYYVPLSSWKGSKDYDSRLIEERPAEGYDARVTGYLPFYRHLAVTGAFEQWKGDRVASFAGSDSLERDPTVWSYGLEWTPVPALSASVNQRHSGNQKETQFGLTFNYMFDMPWEDQISADTVAEMRTVEGSRHDFVDRQSEMILEYQAKDAYRIIYVGKVASNTFQFQLLDGFGQVKSNKAVRVEAEYASFAGGASTAQFTTDRNGEFIVFLNTVTATPVFLTITAGQTTQRFAVDADITKPEVVVVPPPAPPAVAPKPYAMEADTKTLVQSIPTKVIFTFKQGDTPVAANTPVTFITNNDLTGLPANATTDADGKVTVTNLTGATPGTYEVKAEIEGETVSVDIEVIAPDTYTLEVAPPSLVRDKATDVTFTFKFNNTPVPPDTSVLFTTPNNAFTGLPDSEQKTDADGKVKVVGLTGRALGNYVVGAEINGKAVSVTIAVTGPYSLSATPFTLTENIETEVLFTFRQGSSPAANAPVVFADNSAFTNLPTNATTNGFGQVRVTNLKGTAGHQVVEAEINGETVQTFIEVIEPYSLEALPNTLVQAIGTKVVFTFKQGDSPVFPNTPVTFKTNTDLTGLPDNAVQTDGNGQFTVTNLTGATVGNYTVEAVIYGATVSVPITVTPAIRGLVFTSANEDKDFNDPNKGYQSTIEVTAEYNDGNGQKKSPIGYHVVWAVDTVDNPDAQWWLRNNTDMHGLTWGGTANGKSMWAADSVEGNVSTTDKVEITDVVGSRSVTLEASACVGGNNNETTETACNTSSGHWLSGKKTVIFGDGPLSVFATEPQNLRWATASGARDPNAINGHGSPLNSALSTLFIYWGGAILLGDFLADNVSFPAIDFAAGTHPNRTGFAFAGAEELYFKATFPSSGWALTEIVAGGSRAYYAEGSKLPKHAQIMAVATASPDIPSKGAAHAAGWPLQVDPGPEYIYMSGEVVFGNPRFPSYFSARGVVLTAPSPATGTILNDTHVFVVGVK